MPRVLWIPLVSAVLIVAAGWALTRGKGPTNDPVAVEGRVVEGDEPLRARSPRGDPIVSQAVPLGLGSPDPAAVDGKDTSQGTPRDTVSDLVALIEDSADLQATLLAVQKLAGMGGKMADDALLRIARDPGVPSRVRAQAVLALGGRSVEVARPALLEFAASGDRGVRLAALRSLGLLGDPGTLRALETVIWSEEDSQVRQVAIEAVARLGSPGTVDTLLAMLERPGLESAVDRGAILKAISSVSSASAVPELLSAVARSDDRELRAALVRGLASTADSRALDVLIEAASGLESDEARLDAINALGLIGDPRALPVLETIQESGDERARRFTRTAIERIEGG